VMVTHDARLLMETNCDLWVCGHCDVAKRKADAAAGPAPRGKKDAGVASARAGDDPEPFSGAIRFDGDFAAYAAKIIRECT